MRFRYFLLWALTATSPVLAQSKRPIAPLPSAQPKNKTNFGRVELKRTRFRGFEAWRFSDGHSFATVVPALARVMEYGLVGGKNELWNHPTDLSGPGKERGGDKTWLAPQSQWPLIAGSRWSQWPPDAAWEQVAHTARVLPGPVLRVDGPVSRTSGVALSREYSFAPNGDFVISQIAAKKSGPPLYFSLWSVTQVPSPEAVWVPLNPESPYKQGFHWQSAPLPQAVAFASAKSLQLKPVRERSYKIGTDSPVAAIISVQGGVAFRLRAPKPAGRYPDGADQAGFPVEIFSSGLRSGGEFLVELELLGPLKLTRAGQSWRHTVRWDLRKITQKDLNAEAFRAEIESLLGGEILKKP